jgi:hypothetical protein
MSTGGFGASLGGDPPAGMTTGGLGTTAPSAPAAGPPSPPSGPTPVSAAGGADQTFPAPGLAVQPLPIAHNGQLLASIAPADGNRATTGGGSDSPQGPHPERTPGSPGSGGSTSGGFFFGYAALLVLLLLLGAQSLGRRLEGAPARCRPVPFLSLLERPG